MAGTDDEDASVQVAGNGRYLFRLDRMEQATSGAAYAKTLGSVVQGQRMQVTLRVKARGSGSRMHIHDNEQFTWVVKGTLRVRIGEGEEALAPAGTLIYVPAGMPHATAATDDEDVLFFACKDMSDLIYGRPVEESATG
jgi:quercetin dioxygenase-like cupin family protein